MTDISSQGEVVKSLTSAIKTMTIPHLLFYGPPGTGKTSTILAVARDLYGPALMRSRVMELNASDERGIAVIREKVKGFAMHAVGTSVGVAPFKLIILDEADSLTPDAQAALRRTIETYSKVTRFCIICNYVSRIIEPLASRCSKFRFKPLDTESMMARLRGVCEAEGVTAPDEALVEVLRVAGGDMRKAITFLQSASDLYGKVIKPEDVVEISGIYPDKELAAVLETVKNGDHAGVLSATRTIVTKGYAMTTVMEKVRAGGGVGFLASLQGASSPACALALTLPPPPPPPPADGGGALRPCVFPGGKSGRPGAHRRDGQEAGGRRGRGAAADGCAHVRQPRRKGDQDPL